MTPDEWRAAVGQQLEAARKAAGIKSMREAARRAGFSEATWRQLESGKRQLAPGHVVAPSPKRDTLIAAARVVHLDPVQLVADAGGSLEDVSYAEDWIQSARNAAVHGAVAQTMVRKADGTVGFVTGLNADQELIAWINQLPRRDQSRLARMVTFVARRASEQTAATILEQLGIEAQPGDTVSVLIDPQDPAAGYRTVRVGTVPDAVGAAAGEFLVVEDDADDEELASAARGGSPLFNPEDLGPVTDRPPVGATPEEPEGA